jgi:hypothetical protein
MQEFREGKAGPAGCVPALARIMLPLPCRILSI